MESQPQNPEFRINPENLHPCIFGLSFHLLSFFIYESSLGSDETVRMHRLI